MSILLQLVFTKLLEISLAASLLVLLLLLLRRIGRKLLSPLLLRWMWFILILKLVIPLNIASPLSIENWTDPYIYDQSYGVHGALQTASQGWDKLRERWGIGRKDGENTPSPKIYKAGVLAEPAAYVIDPKVAELRREGAQMDDVLNGISLIWLGGCLLYAGIAAYRNRKEGRLLVRTIECEDPKLLQLFKQCKQEMGITRGIRLRLSGTAYPALYGVIKPHILLPYDYSTA